MKRTWYQLPEKDCERLNRSEMNAMRWCLAAINSVAYAQDDLAKRLECIPNGKVRWRLMLGQLRALLDDILGTIPKAQCKNIKHVMDDMELRMVPKYTPKTDRVNMGIEQLSWLVNAARKDTCMSCIRNGDECRTCDLYKILESIAPREEWGPITMCPYYNDDWMDEP